MLAKMRDAFISILAVLLVASPIECTDMGKDGFNFYKDYLRGRSDDVAEGPTEDRMLYFYRTPIPLNPSYVPALELEYRKRTGNAFKNHMLNKEMWDGTVSSKRSSKTALSFLMQSKHPYYTDDVPDDKSMETGGANE